MKIFLQIFNFFACFLFLNKKYIKNNTYILYLFIFFLLPSYRQPLLLKAKAPKSKSKSKNYLF